MAERIYLNFNYPSGVEGTITSLTGIRTKNDDIQYVSGFYLIPGATQVSFVYKGTLLAYDIENINNWHALGFPSTPESTVISTILYGPDVIDDDIIRVVGSYTITQVTGDFGCLYEGPLDGSGKWSTLTPPSSDKVLNTICHSVMGGLVVGNYQSESLIGKAFIYNIKEGSYQEIVKLQADSITAYGIWHNGGDKYTICGGLNQPSQGIELDIGYIVDYDSESKELYNWAEYGYNNDRQSLITHFDGISGLKKNAYTLAGLALYKNGTGSQAFFALVYRNCMKKFEQEPSWEAIDYPGANSTTSNSVTGTTVIGAANFSDNVVNGYAAVLLL